MVFVTFCLCYSRITFAAEWNMKRVLIWSNLKGLRNGSFPKNIYRVKTRLFACSLICHHSTLLLMLQYYKYTEYNVHWSVDHMLDILPSVMQIKLFVNTFYFHNKHKLFKNCSKCFWSVSWIHPHTHTHNNELYWFCLLHFYAIFSSKKLKLAYMGLPNLI